MPRHEVVVVSDLRIHRAVHAARGRGYLTARITQSRSARSVIVEIAPGGPRAEVRDYGHPDEEFCSPAAVEIISQLASHS